MTLFCQENYLKLYKHKILKVETSKINNGYISALEAQAIVFFWALILQT